MELTPILKSSEDTVNWEPVTREFVRISTQNPRTMDYRITPSRSDTLECENHDCEEVRSLGQEVYVVREPRVTGRKKKSIVFLHFYCSVACQRQNALQVRGKARLKWLSSQT